MDKKQETPSNKTQLIAGIIVLAVFGFIIYSATKEPVFEINNTASTEQRESTEDKPTQQTEDSLASQVDSELKKSYGVEDYTELLSEEQGYPNLGFVNEIEDMNSGTIRVYVQTDLTKEESEALGRNIFATTGLQIEELETVVVRATDGLDVNVFRSEIPALR